MHCRAVDETHGDRGAPPPPARHRPWTDGGQGSPSKPAPGHEIHPYLLRKLAVTRPGQVRAIDITRVPPPGSLLRNRLPGDGWREAFGIGLEPMPTSASLYLAAFVIGLPHARRIGPGVAGIDQSDGACELLSSPLVEQAIACSDRPGREPRADLPTPTKEAQGESQPVVATLRGMEVAVATRKAWLGSSRWTERSFDRREDRGWHEREDQAPVLAGDRGGADERGRGPGRVACIATR